MAAFRGGMSKVPTRLLGGLIGLGTAAYGINESIFTGKRVGVEAAGIYVYLVIQFK